MSLEISRVAQSYQGSTTDTTSKQAANNEIKTENAVASNSFSVTDSVKVETQAKDSDSADSYTASEGNNDDVARQNAQIKKAVDELNKNANNSEVVFGIHDKTNRVTIKLVDKQTRNVIKEFPPEKTLDLLAKAWELAGLMVDEKR